MSNIGHIWAKMYLLKLTDRHKVEQKRPQKGLVEFTIKGKSGGENVFPPSPMLHLHDTSPYDA